MLVADYQRQIGVTHPAILLGMNFAGETSIKPPREGKSMLVLTRRVEQGDQSRIRIGDDIEVILVSVRGEAVRIGVEAPSDVEVHRREVWDERKSGLRADAPGAVAP